MTADSVRPVHHGELAATTQRVPVWVKALDPLSRFGLLHALRQRPEIDLLSDAELASQQQERPPVVALVAVDSLDAAAVQLLRSAAQRGCRRTVLIVSTIDDDALMTAVELRVAAVLRRTDATADRIVQLLLGAASGDGSLPAELLETLIGQVSLKPRQELMPRRHDGLSDRETQVLRLVADGKDTQEIARELSYSERTVKNVLHDVTSRLRLKNRSHAVAYALREGLI